MINALIVALSARNKDTLCTNFELLEHIWHEYDVYDNLDETEETTSLSRSETKSETE